MSKEAFLTELAGHLKVLEQQEQQDICITMHHLPDHFQRRSRQKGKQRSDRIVDE